MGKPRNVNLPFKLLLCTNGNIERKDVQNFPVLFTWMFDELYKASR